MSKKKNNEKKTVLIGKRGRTLGQTIRSCVLLVSAILIAVFLMKFINVDAAFIIIAAVLLLGIIFTVRTVKTNPTNKKDTKDEHETCLPILERYSEKHNIKQLMKDYNKWWEGDHSNYTRMHFAEKIIEILDDNRKYETALRVLYQVAELPLKGRDHYDYDNYLSKMDPYLKKKLEGQRKAQNKPPMYPEAREAFEKDQADKEETLEKAKAKQAKAKEEAEQPKLEA